MANRNSKPAREKQNSFFGGAAILAVGILLGSSSFRMYSDWKMRKTTNKQRGKP